MNNILPTNELIVPEGKKGIILGGGCFWCVEAIFNQISGVVSAESGYSGGWVEHPTYAQVCDKNTGHAEVVKVVYDPETIGLEDLFEIFFEVHDPTTPNRQGNDIGPQYRSVIFYKDQYERATAESVITKLQAERMDKIVTELCPYTNFYKAEPYHQGFYYQNTNQPYCSAVITPKVRKFQKKFADKLK